MRAQSTRRSDGVDFALSLPEREYHSGQRAHRTLSEPRHVDVTGDYAYAVVPATMTFDLTGKQITQTGSVFTVALRKVGGEWRLTASSARNSCGIRLFLLIRTGPGARRSRSAENDHSSNRGFA